MASVQIAMPKQKWSQKITKESNALDLEPGVFTWKDPKKIALSLKNSAEASNRKKGTAFKSAMSMLLYLKTEQPQFSSMSILESILVLLRYNMIL